MAPQRGQGGKGCAVASATEIIRAAGAAVAAVGRRPVPTVLLLLLLLLGLVLVEVAAAAVLFLALARSQSGCASLERAATVHLGIVGGRIQAPSLMGIK